VDDDALSVPHAGVAVRAVGKLALIHDGNELSFFGAALAGHTIQPNRFRLFRARRAGLSNGNAAVRQREDQAFHASSPKQTKCHASGSPRSVLEFESNASNVKLP